MYPERIVKALQRARVHIQAGNPQLALPDLEKSVQKSPKGFEAWFLLGQSHGMLNDHAQAETCLKKAALYQPKNPDLWFNLGIAYSARALFNRAIPCYEKSIMFADSIKVEAYHNLGSCLLEVERYEEAAAIFQGLLRISDTADLQALLGIALQGAGNFSGAISAYAGALDRGMNNYTLNLNLGTCHFLLNDFVQSIELSKAALALKPGDAVAEFNLARTLLEQGEIAQTLEMLGQCSLPAAGPARLFALNYFEPHDPGAIVDQHREWGCRQEAGVSFEPFKAADPERPLRLGFVSADLRHHPVAFFLERLIERIDRAAFSIYFYADVAAPDDVTDRFKRMADGWTSIAGITDQAEVARMIRAQEIDILFDLGGHTSERIRLFANRIAPLQASYLGYGATSGMPEMDYFLTDTSLDPVGLTAAHYTEKLCRLGAAFVTYSPPSGAPPVAALPMLKNGYPTFGAFHKLTKISRETIALWANVLAAIPAAKMLVMAKGLGTESGKERLRQAFSAHGITADRLDLHGNADMDAYLAVHNEVDLLLDCFPWNSHTTAMHGLWMGVPTITMRGRHHAGRFGELILRGLGLDQFIASDKEEFAAIAARMAADSAHLGPMRASLRDRLDQSIHCDHQALASRFEAACRQMWRSHCAGQHEDITVA
jgi:protein O-GlcNAc transferase